MLAVLEVMGDVFNIAPHGHVGAHEWSEGRGWTGAVLDGFNGS